ncbi:MAG: SDR family NAD(P)-dependent oxidoreductase [Deltaproteobacteria bacterium]|nr:SDR family NAD(P)-dependent oxidoreductase [Deltaproteobacteria bacterium]
MKDLKSKVAVITGAADGIGFCLAKRLANEGMKIVLSDINAENLKIAEKKIQGLGAETLSVQVDVSKEAEIQSLSQATLAKFGEVHLLCNNAGVFAKPGLVWKCSREDWQRNIDINLWGVLNGLRNFVPIMLEQDTEAHIMTVASMGGHTVDPFVSPYIVAKFGVVAMIESLYHELKLIGSNIGVSLVCPGFVRTQILNSDAFDKDTNKFSGLLSMFREGVKEGMKPEDVADKAVAAMEKNQFYVFPHDYSETTLRARFDPLLAFRNPELPEKVLEDYGLKKMIDGIIKD